MADESEIAESLIDRLTCAPQYVELMRFRREFDLFDVLGKLSENASSRALAYLLDSRNDHGLGTRFYSLLLQSVRVGASNRPDSSSMLSLSDALQCSASETHAVVEWSTSEGRRIDILIRAFGPNGLKAVVGIENKHWSGKSKNQLEDYQRALADSFRNKFSVLLFIAPSRSLLSEHSTDSECNCKCVACSYEDVNRALEDLESETHGALQLFLRSLRLHFDRSLEGDSIVNAKIRQLVAELYRDEHHRKAINLILNNLPGFSGIADEIVKRTRNALTDSPFKERFYPKNKVDLREIKLSPIGLPNLTIGEHKFEFTYMLYDVHSGGQKSPDIGDEVVVQLYARVPKSMRPEDARQHLERIGVIKALRQKDRRAPDRQQWLGLWVSDPKPLQDFGKEDIETCAELFVEAIRGTIENFIKSIEQHTGPLTPTAASPHPASPPD